MTQATMSASEKEYLAEVAEKQRHIQQEQEGKDQQKQQASGSGESEKKPVQAGLTEQPEPPMPDQHLQKPGIEADMELQPHFMASAYKGSGKLEGMSALITGGDSGIGRAVSVLSLGIGFYGFLKQISG